MCAFPGQFGWPASGSPRCHGDARPQCGCRRRDRRRQHKFSAKIGQKPPKVTCPSGLAAWVGAIIHCIVVPYGMTVEYPATVTVRSIHGGTANFFVRSRNDASRILTGQNVDLWVTPPRSDSMATSRRSRTTDPTPSTPSTARCGAISTTSFSRFRDDEDAWVAIVTGSGRAFCVGADLRDGAGSAGEFPGTFWEKPTLNSFESGWEIFKPVIAAVNGYCLGYGLTLATWCDFVVASERAEFGLPEVQLGVPAIVASIRLPQRLNWADAMELLLTGERIDAERALGDRSRLEGGASRRPAGRGQRAGGRLLQGSAVGATGHEGDGDADAPHADAGGDPFRRDDAPGRWRDPGCCRRLARGSRAAATKLDRSVTGSVKLR